MRRVSVVLVFLALVGVGLASSARPARAHATGGVGASNYRTTITAVEPEREGVHVEIVNASEAIRVTNRTDSEVTVLGYDGEPYLRIGPQGVFRNQRSPATYRNATTTDTQRIPDSADPNAAPDWKRIGDCCSAMWHDHRAHYMGSSAPPAVAAQPDVRRTVIPAWEIELVVDGGPTMVVTGEVEWVPSPPAWPWILLVGISAAVVIALGFTRRWSAVLAVSLVVLIGCETLHVIGNWAGVDVSIGEHVGSAVFALLAIIFGLAALVHLLWRGGEEAAPSVLLAAVAIGITGGFADIEVFANSQVPFAFGLVWARTLVAVTLGVAIGVTVTAGRHLRRRPSDASTEAVAAAY